MVQITWNGRTWPSVEHAYQASKTDDPELIALIAGQPTSGMAKKEATRLMRNGTIIMPEPQRRMRVMFELLMAKFSDPGMRALLAETSDFALVEGNTWQDHFWGVCMGTGCNHLGRMLMTIRLAESDEPMKSWEAQCIFPDVFTAGAQEQMISTMTSNRLREAWLIGKSTRQRLS